jgi:hypothetical protein
VGRIAAAILFGATGGLVVSLTAWALASRALDKQMAAGAERLSQRLGAGTTTLAQRLREGQAQVEATVRQELVAQVPPLVRANIDTTLRSYGLTASTGRQIATVLQHAEDVGLLGLGTTRVVVRRA